MSSNNKTQKPHDRRQSFEMESLLPNTERPWKTDGIVAPKDPGVLNQRYTQPDYEGHPAHSVFVQVQLPTNSRRYRRRKPSQHENFGVLEQLQQLTSPAHRVQFILGKDIEGGHESRPLFSEMVVLVEDGEEIEWREAARWVKFEEQVEEGGRWSKPHVATLSLHSLFELRSLLTNGTVMLDMEANSLEEVADLVCDNMVNAGSLPSASRDRVRQTLLLRHRHQHERGPKNRTNSVGGMSILRNLKMNRSDESDANQSSPSNSRNDSSESQKNPYKVNTPFMKKIPVGAEACNILVGEMDVLEKTLSAFVRLNNASIMGDLTEVPIPTRFLFILLGPVGSQGSFHEIGRAMATLMSDEIFHEVAYRAKRRDHLLAGVDEFLDAVTVLPPGEWDPTTRIEPPAAIPSQEPRKHPPEKPNPTEVDEEEEIHRRRQESGLVRTGKLFGGLRNDLRRKVPWYWSDVKDAFSTQCIATIVFLYFACLSPTITFGGLLGNATGNYMAAMESLVSSFVCGIGYGLFSGQPLSILGSTGPVLVFEAIVYKFCISAELDYMSFRFWIGTWIAVVLMFMVAFDASAYVCYITRFTEENFATLIAFIFIYEAIGNVLSIRINFPIESTSEVYDCFCTNPSNISDLRWTKYSKDLCLQYNGTLIGTDCDKIEPVPNVFLMSIVLFFGTFITSIILKDFKNALFFPSKVRQLISDFAVFIAIVLMTTMDYYTAIPTQKLDVPSEFKPTLSTRTWLINPFVNHFFWWIVSFFPALLGVILIFMDQQITAVIVNRKENKFKKGCGYHLDLFVLAILIQICTTFGLPWCVAATVMSLNHVNSLKLESECAAPGEKPQFLGVREQRVTHVLVFLTIGCSIFLTPLLRHIPMPVLFGVFLYMGVDSLKGLQLFDRILIMFMPVKYQPDHMYLRQVPLSRVHMFTIIQFGCLAVLWLIKSYFYTSILFPLMLVVMIGIRKSLDCVFTRRELKILDDIMPELAKPRPVNSKHVETGELDQPPPYPGNSSAQATIPSKPINITEEVNKTTIWKQVNEGQNSSLSLDEGRNDRLSTMTE